MIPDLKKLRELAMAATQGERWLSDLDGSICVGDDGVDPMKEIGAVDYLRRADFDFTFATSPDVVIALLDEIDRMKPVYEAALAARMGGFAGLEAELIQAIDAALAAETKR